MNDKWLKKITVIDKMRNKLRELIGYKEGKRFIIETEPFLKEYSDVELANIANIEQKLKKAIEENAKVGKTVEGIDEKEAECLIKFIVQRDREILDKEGKKDRIKNNSLQGLCGLSQGVITTYLNYMGLKPRVSNINPTISGKGLGGHAFNSVAVPIKDKTCIREKDYLIDVTYRQFFIRDEYSISGRFVKDKRFGNKVAPMAGYWCINLQGGKKFAHEMLKNGFTELTPKNAKIYGDSFILEKQKDHVYKDKYEEGVTIPISTIKHIETGISGEQYLQWFKDEGRQDYEGIDYYDGELEEYYGELMKTPLMMKKEFERNVNQVSEKCKEDTINKDILSDNKDLSNR